MKPVKNEGLTICQLSKIRYSGLSLSTSSDRKLYWNNNGREIRVISQSTLTNSSSFTLTFNLFIFLNLTSTFNLQCLHFTLYLYVNLALINYKRILMNFIERRIPIVYSERTSSYLNAFASFGVVGKSSLIVCPIKLFRQLDVIRSRHTAKQPAMETAGSLNSWR